jgi:bacteriocin-like protein
MSSEEKPRKNPDDKSDKPLTDEQLDQVSGGSESYLKSATEQKEKSPTGSESEVKRLQ